MNLQHCPICHMPIWDTWVDPTINARFSPVYCQCLTITIHLNDYAVEALRSISRQLNTAAGSTNSNLQHCTRCGWFCNLAYHSSEECEKHVAWNGAPAKTAVPPGIYNAFSDEEVSL